MLVDEKLYREQGRPTKLKKLESRYYVRGQACMALKLCGPLTSVELSEKIGVDSRGLRKLLEPCPLIEFEREEHAYSYSRSGSQRIHVVKRAIMVYRYAGE